VITSYLEKRKEEKSKSKLKFKKRMEKNSEN